MKYLIVILLFVCIPNKGLKADSETLEIMKVLTQYPSLNKFPTNTGDASVFWNFIVTNNRTLKGYIVKESRLQEKVQLYLASEMKKIAFEFDLMRDLYNPSSTEKLISGMCGTGMGIIRILEDRSTLPNASMFPNGIMMVTISLLDELTNEELMGVFAHELAHYYLRHTEVNKYIEVRRERRNDIIAGIEEGAVRASDVYAKSQGVKVDDQQTEKNVEGYYRTAADNTLRHYLKYSRIQEIEADLVACYFLDWMGIGKEHYVNALKKISKYSYPHGDHRYSTHPDMEARIGMFSNNLVCFDSNKDEKLRAVENEILATSSELDKKVYDIVKNNQGVYLSCLPIGDLQSSDVVKSIKRLLFKRIIVKEGGNGKEYYYVNIKLLINKGEDVKTRNNGVVVKDNDSLYE